MRSIPQTLAFGFLITGLALGQPGGPPGPPRQPGPARRSNATLPSNSGGAVSNLSLPHVVGTLSNFLPTRFTVKREMGEGGPTANMDFRMQPSAFQGPGLKSGSRVVVVYQMNSQGGGYEALAVVGFPQGNDPSSLIQGMPKLK